MAYVIKVAFSNSFVEYKLLTVCKCMLAKNKKIRKTKQGKIKDDEK
jgi:hypothetical protein